MNAQYAATRCRDFVRRARPSFLPTYLPSFPSPPFASLYTCTRSRSRGLQQIQFDSAGFYSRVILRLIRASPRLLIEPSARAKSHSDTLRPRAAALYNSGGCNLSYPYSSLLFFPPPSLLFTLRSVLFSRKKEGKGVRPRASRGSRLSRDEGLSVEITGKRTGKRHTRTLRIPYDTATREKKK